MQTIGAKFCLRFQEQFDSTELILMELALARQRLVKNFNTECYENPIHSLMDNRRSQRDGST